MFTTLTGEADAEPRYKNGYYGDGTAIDRIPQPDRETYTLYDYRRRLATYRADQDLLLSHQQFAWIPVWDDHGTSAPCLRDLKCNAADMCTDPTFSEVADNTWRDGSAELNNTQDSFVKDGGVSTDQRKMNAVRAYFEWMPIRQVDMDDK